MDRRKFLQGTFGGVTAGGIILAAGAPDIEAFVAMAKKDEPLIAAPGQFAGVEVGLILFNYLHQPVAVVKEIRQVMATNNATRWGSSWEEQVPGLVTTEITAIAQGIADIRVGR